MKGSQYFYDTWKIAESYAQAHAGDAGIVVPADRLPPRKPATRCDPPRVLDALGECVTDVSLPAASRAEPPIEATTDDTVLESGAYTLHLQTNRAPSELGVVRQRDFAAELVATGRALTLRDPAVEGRGGFGRDRYFVMHLRAGAQRLALVAFAPQGGKLDEVHGAFVSYVAGGHPTRGGFRLRRAATSADSKESRESLETLPSFLESLRK
jgi:hypothetical protein